MDLLQCSKCRNWLCPTDFALATKTKRERQRYCLNCCVLVKAETRAAHKAKHAVEGIDFDALGDQWCSQCKTSKPAREMAIDTSTPTGLRSICKACGTLQQQAYYATHAEECKAKRTQRYADNPEPERLYKAQYRTTHSDKITAYGTAWRPLHREEARIANHEWSQTNPKRRQELNVAHRARKKHAPKVERIVRKVVFERDKWICQLCFHKTNPTVKYPHPDSPTIDHIVPLSKGGSHTYANVVCVHAICNSTKKNRAITQQIRLF